MASGAFREVYPGGECDGLEGFGVAGHESKAADFKNEIRATDWLEGCAVGGSGARIHIRASVVAGSRVLRWSVGGASLGTMGAGSWLWLG